ncbi:hypothetical protein CI109_104562 [Kwoniella shandongensis]|uniref:Uncharacterized protein n=1 Tax=Kwoniella shandongensis TaxID=1734106 RepID=A0A5M6BTE1_9TREE|nr:uncharacterized protein CI109_005548 [Kwoniella shandongensis]KAA5526114.1 hypothetical protein CI109_005548 [Kwoniella shandongensis]
MILQVNESVHSLTVGEVLKLLGLKDTPHKITIIIQPLSSEMETTKIDPLFQQTSETDMLLVSSDNVGFYCKSSVLAYNIGFFSDYETIDQAMGEDCRSSTDNNDIDKDNEKITVRELPSATSAGLKLVLLVLSKQTDPPATLHEFLQRTYVEADLLDALCPALAVADAYDIPMILDRLSEVHADEPFMLLSLSLFGM